MFTRSTAVVSATLLGVSMGACLCACSDGSGAPEEPVIERVLLVTCDTLRADRLGLYGCTAGTSPSLDAFAESARVYDEAYSTTALTHPAMSAIMTGRMPDEVGMSGGNRRHMPGEVVTLAELLESQGIATAAVVSNWVLRSAAASAGTGIAQGFGHYDDEMDVRELNRPAFERTGAGTTDAAIAWMQSAAAGPYFLWVHYQDPHGPYTAPEEFEHSAADPPDERSLVLGTTHSGARQLPNYQVIDGELGTAFYRARYDAEVRYFDQEVGRLFDWLAQQDLLDSSLIVFTADHGESLGEHEYWFCHGETLARELVRVPLMVRSPRTPVGRSSAVAGHLDLFATILDGFGLPLQPSRGVSLLAESAEAVDAAGSGRALVQTLFRRGSTVRLEVVSDGHWRLHQDARGTRLFDVLADPAEERDLAASEPEVVRRLQQQGRRFWRQAPGALVVELAESEPDEESLRALDALGYTGGEEQ